MAREYEIQKVSGRCGGCQRELAGGEEFVAALFDTDEGFRREDLCRQCADGAAGRLEGAFSAWQGRMPTPDAPKKKTVDEEVLVSFFDRLAGEEASERVNFRFVLALMLMRKKRLVYDGSRRDESGREIWTMHFRKESGGVEVVHPEMDEEQIAAVTKELTAIFETES